MIDNLEAYRIWAPDRVVWSEWAKPVLFTTQVFDSEDSLNPLKLPEIRWLANLAKNTMIIVDLPAEEGVKEGIALAKLGYRPVPLYNGVDAPPTCQRLIVPVRGIINALYKGVAELQMLSIQKEAPPVFLLDANRMAKGNKGGAGEYDNRWCVFPQDMPSASFLLKQGIKRIILRSENIQNDLAHVLGRYQEQGIEIYLCDGYTFQKENGKLQPSKFKGLRYRFQVISGLVRNPAGGFGGMIPEPTQSQSSSHHRSRHRSG